MRTKEQLQTALFAHYLCKSTKKLAVWHCVSHKRLHDYTELTGILLHCKNNREDSCHFSI